MLPRLVAMRPPVAEGLSLQSMTYKGIYRDMPRLIVTLALLREQGVGGSNPLTPTSNFRNSTKGLTGVSSRGHLDVDRFIEPGGDRFAPVFGPD
jgi:hypothetical protein